MVYFSFRGFLFPNLFHPLLGLGLRIGIGKGERKEGLEFEVLVDVVCELGLRIYSEPATYGKEGTGTGKLELEKLS